MKKEKKNKKKKNNKDQPRPNNMMDELTEETEQISKQDMHLGVKLSSEEILVLQNDLDDAQKKSEEYLDGWQRSRAEFANYKKRIEKERFASKQKAVGIIIKKYLTVLDDMDRALKEKPTVGEGADWAKGIDLIHRNLQQMLESEGVVLMKVEGEMFDPKLHEAVLQTESNKHESGQIIEVLQNGYCIGDQVIKPAQVHVAA